MPVLCPRLFRSLLSPLTCALVIGAMSGGPAVAQEAERTMALIELRTGDQPHPQTLDYLSEVATGVQKEAVSGVVLVPMAKSADVLRRDRDPTPMPLTDERRKALDALRKQGIAHLDNADAQAAITTLKAAESKYRVAIAAPGADERLRKDYLDVLAQLATAHVVAKDRDAAGEVFRTVVNVFGAKAHVTDDNYRPDVVEVFKRVAKELGVQPKGGVDVTSEPSGAHVLINGIDRGVTPITVTDLVPGTYAIRLQAGAANSALHRVKVTPGGKPKLAVDIEFERHLLLDDARVGLGYADVDAISRRVLADAVTLGKELGVSSIAAVGVLDGTLYAWLVDVTQARMERTSAVKVPATGTSPRAVAKVLGTLLGDRGKQDDGASATAETAGPWYASVPGIVCGAGALVALGVGGAYAPNLFVTEVHTQAEKDTATTGRTISAVSLGAGALLAGAAAFFFVRQSQAGANATSVSLGLPPVDFGTAPAHFPSVSVAGPARH